MYDRSRCMLFAVLLLFAVSPATAGVPSPDMSTVPDVLTLVGRGPGGVDTSAPFTVVVRWHHGEPFDNASVILDFSGCPDLKFCADQPEVVGGPMFVQCAGNNIRAITGPSGTLTFHVQGGAANSGAVAGPTGPSLKVYADGVLLKVVRVAALDQIGNNGLDPNDHASWLADAFSGQAYARSDYNGDGTLDPNDLSLWLGAFFSGASALGCGPTCP